VFCTYVPRKNEKEAEQIKRWKNSVTKFLLVPEETSKSKLNGSVLGTLPCVLHFFDLLTQNILEEKYNLTKILIICLMMVLGYCSGHEYYFRHWPKASIF
jgi:hypothetical protein